MRVIFLDIGALNFLMDMLLEEALALACGSLDYLNSEPVYLWIGSSLILENFDDYFIKSLGYYLACKM